MDIYFLRTEVPDGLIFSPSAFTANGPGSSRWQTMEDGKEMSAFPSHGSLGTGVHFGGEGVSRERSLKPAV